MLPAAATAPLPGTETATQFGAPVTPNRVPLAIERPAAPITLGSSGGGFVPNGDSVVQAGDEVLLVLDADIP